MEAERGNIMEKTKETIKNMVIQAIKEDKNLTFSLYSVKNGGFHAEKYTFYVLGGEFKVFNGIEVRVEDLKKVFESPLYEKDEACKLIEENKLANRIKKVEEMFNF